YKDIASSAKKHKKNRLFAKNQSKMKTIMILFVTLVITSSIVQGQTQVWTGLKCGMDNDKLYDRSLGIDTCLEYCHHAMPDGKEK
ncbi:hypothetical protein Bhyg_09257, partial [Pseudolycoriella hygida]